MATYPAGKDVFANPTSPTPRNNPSLAGLISAVGDTVEAVQEELGYGGAGHTPRGAAAHLTDRLDAIEATILKPGMIFAYGGAAAPAGFLLCDGSFILRTGANANLFAAIGTAYNLGGDNDNTRFRLPDLRQRFPLGKAAAGVGATLGGSGGAIGHTHTGPSHAHTGPAHTHPVNPPVTNTGNGQDFNQNNIPGTGGGVSGGQHSHPINIAGFDSGAAAFGGNTTGNAGAQQTDGSDPPYQVVNYLIKL
jgi:microcystin-dependent protein